MQGWTDRRDSKNSNLDNIIGPMPHALVHTLDLGCGFKVMLYCNFAVYQTIVMKEKKVSFNEAK